MKRAASYPAQTYDDPNDVRFVRIVRPADASQKDAVNIIGVPFDGGVLGRRGAAGGPPAIREAMSGFSNYNVELGESLEGSRVFDLGDLLVDQEDVLKAHPQIEAEMAKCLAGNSLLVVLGGDNSLSLPCIRASGAKFGKLGLIVIDSHFDLRGRIGGKPTSGSSYGLAIETMRELDPRRVVEVGVHGFLNSKDYFEKAKKLGIKVVTASEARSKGPREVAKEAYEAASDGADAVYLSVDLDAVDLSYVSGVSAPSAGGIPADYLLDLLYELGKMPGVRCADLVELAPSLDPTGKSARVAASALVYLIAGFNSRRKARH
ncbi:MAG: agmatinase family protein [Nitrososphaerota archaeon]|nr:agmatinase family protein [Nitrososphaerota archaeon]